MPIVRRYTSAGTPAPSGPWRPREIANRVNDEKHEKKRGREEVCLERPAAFVDISGTEDRPKRTDEAVHQPPMNDRRVFRPCSRRVRSFRGIARSGSGCVASASQTLSSHAPTIKPAAEMVPARAPRIA